MKRTILSLLLAMTMTVSCCQPVMASDQRPTKWDVSMIYADDAAMQEDISRVKAYGDQIYAYKGKMNNVDNIVKVFELSDKADVLMSHLYWYANMQTSLDNSDDKSSTLAGNVDNIISDIEKKEAFIDTEILANNEALLDKVQSDSRMEPFDTAFTRLRQSSNHVLDEHDTKLLIPIDNMISGAYELYSQLTYAELPVEDIIFPDGVTRKANDNNYSLVLSDSYSQDFRVKFRDKMLEPYKKLRTTYAKNYSNYCYGVSESAKAYGYTSTLERSLDEDGVAPEMYNNLMKASIESNYVIKEYADMLKQEIGTGKVYYSDLTMAHGDSGNKKYTYDEACDLILKALQPLGEQYVADAEALLEKGVVDVYPDDSKTTGAFAFSVSNVSPFILTNFDGTYSEVDTIAHELGHAMNMLYSDRTQKSIYEKNVSSTVSEVTSTLNELLLNDYMIDNAKTNEEKKYYISSELTLLYRTFFTQMQYAYYQQNSLSALENGEILTADKLDSLWMDSLNVYNGDSISKSENDASGWERIPHFYMGFYVYKYAAAISAASDISQRIENGEEGALEGYLAYIAAGDTASVQDTYKIAGVDTTNTDFAKGLTDRFEALIKEYKSL